MSKERSKEDLEQEIIKLRAEVFNLRSEVQSLRGSRVVGRIIRARDKLVPVAHKIPKLPGYIANRLLYFSKEAVIAVLPGKTTESIKKQKKRLKNKVKAAFVTKQRPIVIDNTTSKDITGPLLTVVIPYYNQAHTVDETLESLSAQTFTRFEVIVVNDGSTDKDSIKKLDNLKENYPHLHIKVINKDNGGVASARNSGVSEAKTEYIICLDSDDILHSSYIEKVLLVLESRPDISIVTTDREDFGVVTGIHRYGDFNPLKLYSDNMVTTAAAYRKSEWEKVGGYKIGIGYEDWEFWLNLVEKGANGYTLHEPLFKYRVAMHSRFVEDRSLHWDTVQAIHSMHKSFKSKVTKLQNSTLTIRDAENGMRNMLSPKDYTYSTTKRPHVMIAIPWMAFGGAETLIYNFTRQLAHETELTFVTGIASTNEWEYKFREVSDRIYHLPELLPDSSYYLEFLSHYITTRSVDILHIIHSGYVFDILSDIKKRHPELKVIVTMFNDRVDEYVEKTIANDCFIDIINTDSSIVAKSFQTKMGGRDVKVIPNGVDTNDEFNKKNFDELAVRREIKLNKDHRVAIFAGRLSEEKNPDVFLHVARRALKTLPNMKFVLIGDGPMRQELESFMYKNKLKNCIYLGYQKNVAKYLSAADIFILPSAIEGFPLSILEAMSMELAVIASRVGAVPDVITDSKTGFVTRPGDSDAIYEALEKLQNNTILQSLQTSARKEVLEKYTIEQVGNHYRGVYKELLGL